MERVCSNLEELLDRDTPFRERLELVAAFVIETRGLTWRCSLAIWSATSRGERAALRERIVPPYSVLKPYFAQAAAAGEFGHVPPETAAALFHLPASEAFDGGLAVSGCRGGA